jgi:hypothetical protein
MSSAIPLGRVYSALSTVQKYRFAVGLIVVAQAAWLGSLASRGWYYQDDFTFLAEATGRPFDWGYLTEPLNDHLVPGLRASFWVMQHFFPMNYGLTIAVRLVLQGIATWLLFRFLTYLFGLRRELLLVVLVYAMSPLLVPGVLYLSTAVNVLPSQICVILAYDCHVRGWRTRSKRHAAHTGLALLVAACFWEKTAVNALLLPLLSIGWLESGSLRKRLAALVRHWTRWVLVAGPLAAFVAYFILMGYGRAARTSSLGAGLDLGWAQWSRALWPGVIGGPWRWFALDGVFAPIADPTTSARIVGQAAFLVLLAVGLYRRRSWALAAWALPAISVIVGMGLVGLGRYALFGTAVPLGYSYVFDLAVPTALAACLSLLPSQDFDESPRHDARAIKPAVFVRGATGRLAWACALVAVLLAGWKSSTLFADRWSANPGSGYFSTLTASLARSDSRVNLYDTGLPLDVMPYLTRNRHLSDLLRTAQIKSVSFDGSAGEPQVVNESGKIVPAVFYVVASGSGQGHLACPNLLQGPTSQLISFPGTVSANEYFLRVYYYELRPTSVRFVLRDSDGKIMDIANDASTTLGFGPGVVTLRLPLGAPLTLDISSSNAATNVCFTSVQVGTPFPKK